MSASSIVFLVDECLHPSLVNVANEMGFPAHHVDRLGMKGAKDWQLLHRAVSQGLTLVTNNALDFRKLAARAAIHPGLILILPVVRPAQQRILFRVALNALAGRTELVNRVMEIDQEGATIVLREHELPNP